MVRSAQSARLEPSRKARVLNRTAVTVVASPFETSLSAAPQDEGCIVSGSFHPSSIVLAARCARVLFHFASLPQKRGDGAPSDATILYVHASLRRRGASRRAVRRSPSASGRAFRWSSNDRRQPSSWQAARSGRPGGAPMPPECVLARHARRRRSTPHEPAQPVRVPHGSGQLRVYNPIGILSRGGLWTMMARESKSNALSAQK